LFGTQVLHRPLVLSQPDGQLVSLPHCPAALHVCELVPLHRWLFGAHTPVHAPLEHTN
jgi:hypothetical protein